MDDDLCTLSVSWSDLDRLFGRKRIYYERDFLTKNTLVRFRQRSLIYQPDIIHYVVGAVFVRSISLMQNDAYPKIGGSPEGHRLTHITKPAVQILQRTRVLCPQR